MIRIVTLFVILSIGMIHGADHKLPSEIEKIFRMADQPSPDNPEIPYREKKSFVDYVTSNWREIAKDIECLPPKDGQELEKGVKFNCSVINFGFACGHLPPTEYLDFFDAVVTLYEQKRISFIAFQNIYYGADEKESFWSVNWEHPRVQLIFKRIQKFEPPPDKDFLSMVEDQARGKLADNYMVNRSDDGPLPQTLPGIKLQRPFASVIRRFEARTGKRVPADPDFPDHHNTRPSKKSLRESQLGAQVVGTVAMAAKPWWRSSGFLISLVVGLLLVAFWIRSWMRPY